MISAIRAVHTMVYNLLDAALSEDVVFNPERTGGEDYCLLAGPGEGENGPESSKTYRASDVSYTVEFWSSDALTALDRAKTIVDALVPDDLSGLAPGAAWNLFRARLDGETIPLYDPDAVDGARFGQGIRVVYSLQPV